jgi:ornithine cyclodeaminase/alanine dehydrogenase-like protein (mu-crystallin family)
MIALSASDVLSLLTPGETVALVEAAALAAAGSSDWVVPQRQHVKWAQGTLLTMPAIGAGAMAVKLVSVVPGNAGRKLPVTNGLLILSDAGTGLPLAIMDAAALTAMRTGAVGALGLKYITPAGVDSVGIVGAGVQGAWQAITACAVRPIRTVLAVRRSPAGFERFCAALAAHAPAVTVVACESAAEVLSRTAVIVTATTSAEPVLPDDPALLGGRHFIAIGSYERHMREVPDAVFQLAGHLVLDSEFARHEVGESIRAVEHVGLRDTDLFTIGELVAGRRSVDVARTTAYKSAGMALYDLYVARALYEAARRRGIGQELAL